MKKFMMMAFAMCIGATVFTSCNKNADGASAEASLVGQWTHDRGYGSLFVYNFVDDSTGTYDAGSFGKQNFKYSKTADTLSITYEGNTTPMMLAYKLSNDTLTVFDSFGEPVAYAKNK